MTKKMIVSFFLIALITLIPGMTVSAQDHTPEPTTIPTEETRSSERPVVMIDTFAVSSTPSRGENFSMSVLFLNTGNSPAYNMFIEFVSGDLIPRGNGGTQTIYQLVMGEKKGISQSFTVSPDLWSARLASVMVNLEYSDSRGNTYSDSFSIAIDLNTPAYNPATEKPTPTPTQMPQPQLVITTYETDIDTLQPGTAFELSLSITNLGSGSALSASMVLGGGSVEVNPEGTPQPGISGGDGEFATFAPLESSNVKYIGNIGVGETINASQKIIVNVSTAPGAYSLKYSFLYTTETGERVEDNQVITLLIYRMPSIEVGFYQDPGPLFAFQPNNLPLQIMNLGKQSVVLGNMMVASENATLENNTALVGPVDAGFYFTLDTMIIPNQPGQTDLLISVNYTDDFNQPRVYETVLTLEVIEAEIPSGGEGFPGEGLPPGEGMPGGDFPGEGPSTGTETFWQKIIRFFRGLFGLDSGRQEGRQTPGSFEEMPGESPRDVLPPMELP